MNKLNVTVRTITSLLLKIFYFIFVVPYVRQCRSLVRESVRPMVVALRTRFSFSSLLLVVFVLFLEAECYVNIK